MGVSSPTIGTTNNSIQFLIMQEHFITAPLVERYITNQVSTRELERELHDILNKEQRGEELTAVELETYSQFKRYFNFGIEYQLDIDVSGYWEGTNHTMVVSKDFYESIEVGDSDYDNSDLTVSPYDLVDDHDALSIEKCTVEEKSIRLIGLQIKEEFRPLFRNLMEGGAA